VGAKSVTKQETNWRENHRSALSTPLTGSEKPHRPAKKNKVAAQKTNNKPGG
jgi:hypothetical protein